MAMAIVICSRCRCSTPFGKERWRGNRVLCAKCYDLTRKGLVPTPESPQTPSKCETCSGAETRCKLCGGMLCRPIDEESCEQDDGGVCSACVEKSLGKGR